MANELAVRQNFIGGLVEDSPLSSGATTLTSAGLAAVVAIGSTEHMKIVLDPDGVDGAPEIAFITAHTASATTATISRGQLGTSGRQHLAGIPWVHAPVAEDLFSAVFHAQDQKTNGTHAGTSTGSSWNTRVLNTVITNTITGASLTSNVISLPAGVYEVDASAPAYNSSLHRTRIRNTTASTDLALGSSEYTNSNAQTVSFVRGRFTLTATSNIELQHYFTSGQASTGLGNATSAGVVEVYAEIVIRKVT